MNSAPATQYQSKQFRRSSDLRVPARFRSRGEIPNLIQAECREEDLDDDRERQNLPQTLEDFQCEEALISELFDSVSALKSVYIRLQEAHFPYEPTKIREADQSVVSVLHSIKKLENSYLQDRRRLKSALLAKDSEILNLRWGIKLLGERNEELERMIKKQISPEVELFQGIPEWTPELFSQIYRLAYRSIHDFTKLLIGLMKASGFNLDRAASSICNSVLYAERSHKKFAFEAYLSQVMLGGGADECVNLNHFEQVMQFHEPLEALMQDPDSDFGRFCRSKYLAAVSSKIEASFFDSLDHRSFVMGGGHPRTPFYEAFVKMARRIWVLQVMANSFIPKAEVFYVKRGTKFMKDFMESVVNVSHLAMSSEEMIPRVGFTVMAGFRIGSKVNRCRVYLSRMEQAKENGSLRS
ncbi:hypothetical protein AXF42_Ash016680 [Apostasia shenzhenica]|uniref:Uncharacterized protein n=1 Tax=Apostasia shenzhenica TaxID=1088818 RepID=A0A2I0AQ19_9ASPA|nr:hypothetical protein AXF42_Ash016680 [Apostasia shenzhenica]